MYNVGIITVSDSGYAGLRQDISGEVIAEIAEAAELSISERLLLPDDYSLLVQNLQDLSQRLDLILTTGGTGFAKRDITPEATRAVIEKECGGISAAIVANGLKYTPRAMLSRAVCGIKGSCVILNLPGSPKAVRESLEFVLPSLLHGLEILKGDSGNCARKD